MAVKPMKRAMDAHKQILSTMKANCVKSWHSSSEVIQDLLLDLFSFVLTDLSRIFFVAKIIPYANIGRDTKKIHPMSQRSIAVTVEPILRKHFIRYFTLPCLTLIWKWYQYDKVFWYLGLFNSIRLEYFEISNKKSMVSPRKLNCSLICYNWREGYQIQRITLVLIIC